MIYLITGVPGSGKTLYAVSTLVKSLVDQKLTKDGKQINRRLLVDGIPDLLIPHELMATPKVETMADLIKGKGDEPPPAPVGNGVWNWFEWCQPGDVIVIDEVQRYWRPRGMGIKPPKEIQLLETHRHFGVDFVIITQSPMLIDQNVRRLVGRHQKVRRLLGMQRAIIYDWDGCSATENVKAATATSFFNYPKTAYALYKSSELHTKQKQKIPLWFGIPVLALVGLVLIGPKAYAVMSGAMSGKGIQTAKSDAVPPPVPSPSASVPGSLYPPGFIKAGDNTPGATPPAFASSAPALVIPALFDKQKLAGCIVVKDRCGCYDQSGQKVDSDIKMCLDHSGKDRPPPAQFADSVKPEPMTESQLDAYRFAFLAKPQSLHLK